LDYAVDQVNNEEIDEINILKASFKAMHLAIKKLKRQPQFLLIDGHIFYKYQKIPHLCIVKGDGIYASIAAASILAKTYRDEYMQHLHYELSALRLVNNKGYGTAEHQSTWFMFYRKVLIRSNQLSCFEENPTKINDSISRSKLEGERVCLGLCKKTSGISVHSII
jgi:ribonuclease HII